MNIDLQDALVIYSVLYFFGLISFLTVAQKYKPNFNNSYLFFAGFFFLNSLGVFGIYFRESLPLFVSVVVANSVLYIAHVSLLVAIYRFYKTKEPILFISISSLLYVALFVIFTYLYPNFQIRIFVYASFLIAALGVTYYRYGKEIKSFNFRHSIFGFNIALMAIMLLIRILFLLLPNNADSFLNYNIDSMNIISTSIIGNMLAFGILAIINDQILGDLKRVDSIFINSIKNAPTPIMIHAEDGTVLNISEDWTDRTHYVIEDIPTIYDWTRKAYGKNKEEVRTFIKKLYQVRESKHDGEFVVTTKDGRQLTWDFNSGYIGNLPDGRAVAMSVAMDVTDRLEREKEISYLSYHDQLTGLYNRRFFEEQLARLDNPRNLPLSIIMGDVNGLKLINDAFGHKAGDELLKMIGEIINTSIRSNDVAARWGGDEFAILLPSSGSDAAEVLTKRILEKVKKASFDYGKVSISFGLDTKEKEEDDLSEIFISAEELMYQNKLVEIDSIRGETINTIMNTLFEKSVSVEEHSVRVADLAVQIATKMKLSKSKINDIKSMGMIHDIGKIVIDLNILDKPGKLTDEERNIIQQHPLSGSRMLSSSHEYTRLAAGVLHHHEKIDGSGYPNGLKGDQIPIESKIIGVADAFDAMTAQRPYRKNPLSIEQAISELKKYSGTQFDADVVDVFINKVLK